MSAFIVDLKGLKIQEDEYKILLNPLIGGVILFSRNYQDQEQLKQLIYNIRSINQELIICVDHEGGKVQRFQDGFTKIPAMGDILKLADFRIDLAKQLAFSCGFLISSELLTFNIDLSFTPVLDIDRNNKAITNRAFAKDKETILHLAESFINGMYSNNMPVVGKHFPGHGGVIEDTHLSCAFDTREASEILSNDMQIFTDLISKNKLDFVMPSHVTYEKLHNKPACFSSFWLEKILRQEIKFQGGIFSDDLSMKGAKIAHLKDRVDFAIKAGCNMVLLCNLKQGKIENLIQTLSASKRKEFIKKSINNKIIINNYRKKRTNKNFIGSKLWQKHKSFLEKYTNNLSYI